MTSGGDDGRRIAYMKPPVVQYSLLRCPSAQNESARCTWRSVVHIRPSGALGDARCTWEAHNLNQGAPQLPKARLYTAGAPGNARFALGIASAPQRHRCTCRSAGAPAGLLADSRAQSSGRHWGQAGRDARAPCPWSAPSWLARCPFAANFPRRWTKVQSGGSLPLFKKLSPQSLK
jgi:hypothetical protein